MPKIKKETYFEMEANYINSLIDFIGWYFYRIWTGFFLISLYNENELIFKILSKLSMKLT